MFNLFLLNIQIAIDGLLTHKLRTVLTMLGVIFGVMAVVSMQAIGEGAQQEILSKIDILGIDNIYIYDQSKIRQDELIATGKYPSKGLRLEDITDIKAILIHYLAYIAPVKDFILPILFYHKKLETTIVGTTPSYFKILKLDIEQGRFFSQPDLENHSRVAVVGGGLYQSLRREQEVLGNSIKIKDEWYQIIGILQKKGTLLKKDDNLDYEDFNYNIYIPISSTILQQEGIDHRTTLTRAIIQVKDKFNLGQISSIIEKALLRYHHHLRDFKIVLPEELLKQRKETQQIFNLVLGLVAFISLLVGGIGIMNIMLASILERTKEIGLRRAMGAKKFDIQIQFLFEAILITIFSGLIGIISSFLITYFVSFYFKMPTKITLYACLLSFFISVIIGVIFGFFPARKASQLNPIDALRYE